MQKSFWSLVLLFVIFVLIGEQLLPRGRNPSAVVATIISSLRNLRDAAKAFYAENSNNLDTIEPEAKLLIPYVDSQRYTKTPGEYIFAEANGEWWVGHNLAAAKINKDLRVIIKKHARGYLFGSMDENSPYDDEDTI